MEVEEGEWGWDLRNWAWICLAWNLVFRFCGVFRRVLTRAFAEELEVIWGCLECFDKDFFFFLVC